MGAPTSKVGLIDRAASNGITLASVFTGGASLKNPDGTSGPGGMLDGALINNSDTIAHLVSLYMVPSAGSADETNKVYAQAIGPGAFDYFSPPGGIPYASSAIFRVKLGEAIATVQANVTAFHHEMA